MPFVKPLESSVRIGGINLYNQRLHFFRHCEILNF